jgi:hypothetical protein
MPRSEDTAFYTVCDARHFVGAVALLNSLRLVGHDDPFVVVDSGLEPWQRELLEPRATIVPAPAGVPPMLLKATGPLAVPARVMAVLDSDVIVTRSLQPVLDQAAAGRIVVFAGDAVGRHFPEWNELLGLGLEPRRQTYVASGHLFVAGEDGLRFLRRFDEAQRALDLSQTLLANSQLVAKVTRDDPLYFPDQDVLNALLATVVDPGDQLVLDQELTPYAPFLGIELVDEDTLRCRRSDGVEPYLLHHILRKPWLEPVRPNLFSRLLPRVLLREDVDLRLDPSCLPLWLREGRFAALDRRRAGTQAFLHDHLRGRLGVRPRVARWLAGRT